MAPDGADKTPEEMAQEQIEAYRVEHEQMRKLNPATDPVPWDGAEKHDAMRVWNGLIVGIVVGLLIGLLFIAAVVIGLLLT